MMKSAEAAVAEISEVAEDTAKELER